jgi:hypothetical protein
LSILEKLPTTPFVAGALAAALWALSGATGCSIVVESPDRQCERDEDCAGFEGAVCDGGACVPRDAATTSTGPGSGASSSASSGTGGCEGDDGCFACEPTKQAEFLNACTNAACVPYDNAQLEGLLLPDGSVPPVP